MIKGKVILVPFPFDDFSATKVRPAICLTHETGIYEHVVIAFINSQLPESFLASELLIEKKDKDFKQTGLAVDSVIKLHKLVTIPKQLIKRELGKVSANQLAAINQKLKNLFELD
ncbi:MAG: type II toxin-antitoxin system PemK/MazF family toxin [Hymenobacteraceae bacterium]|nr:type II toxin-antitoxin system PemK/MazF family toxin [Hymenobacteraceae bacterium]MDX5395520.1 type II toxin-antitoxin system PemK/MazF family toxin [Hymenobacteraceae bacterium]MDX5443379.1 type II toxin-antitoxin system PemK/MazF family toxin [Hymenobacteraceae bacterium]MDX5511574.1 type II toxin-antitoxin system PemK/MazF family toxin [Hymenobacteraceae bacterium]